MLFLRTLATTALAAWLTTVNAKGRFSYYPMLTPASFPCDNTLGPDGAVWVEELLGNKLVRIDPDTGEVSEYDIPFTVPIVNVTLPGTNPAAVSCALVTGYDGLLYASNGLRNQLVQMNVHTKQIRVYDPPKGGVAGNGEPLNDVTAAPDGVYFTQTTANIITKFHYHTHKMETIRVPTPLSNPVGIYYATADDHIWFCEFLGQKIGRLNRHTQKITEYGIPASLAGPIVMRAQTQNRYLYFAATFGNSIGEVDTVTKKIKAYKVPTPFSTPVELCPSRNGDIWFTHILMNSLGRLRPSTGKFKEVTLPGTANPGGPISVPQYVGSGIYCQPGNAVWSTEGLKNRAYRYQLH